MSFLRRLLATLAGFFRPAVSQSAAQQQIAQTPLSRYLFSKNHFSKAKNCVKAAAFLPPADRKLSVQDISNLSSTEIWEIGTRVGVANGRRLKARGDFLAGVAFMNGLRVEVDEPPLGHRNITGWSEAESEAEKESSDLLKATELADASTLSIVP